ncbi:ATP-dependent helicase [Paenibacillus sp. MER TA 81-3]|uniref:ATP-dependent helicase n=1 Tax=Paenibacillus sp. MER TA 81-3 TaxID=2939573 RepID=UPI00203A740A|nr:ATP-dependent helicase [Paenibacillus sp. MER TA 81-3]MCM3339167.1 ATP-dependent helicase [Paenibacillus sp. MER TA 81-3]
MTTPTSSSPAASHWRTRPVGALKERAIPAADQVAPAAQDKNGRTRNDDSFFTALAQQGIHLHEAQRHAVRHDEGPLLCLAGAGSGKTSVLTARAAYLMAVRGVKPEALWLVTFTSKAAQEMRTRLAQLPGVTAAMARRVQARTFHSFALVLLQAYAPPFKLMAEERMRHGMMKRVLRELGLHDQMQAETVLAALSSLKSRRTLPVEWHPQDVGERDMKRAMLRFEEQKDNQGGKDFDDLLLDTLRLLEEDKNLLQRLRCRFQYVMADEFQDTTPVQYELLQLLSDEHRNLAVFGDDDQTIYTFNGACHHYITGFQTRYPDAKQITLNINFRSTAPIVGLGNAIIACNQERLPKLMRTPVGLRVKTKHMANMTDGSTEGSEVVTPLYLRPRDAEEEAQRIAEQIQASVANGQHAWRDFAVLYRTANTSRALVEHFTMQGLPFRQFGAEPLFYDHSQVRPLIDHLRLALEPRNMNAMESAVAALYISREAGMRTIRDGEQQKAKKYPLIHLQYWMQLAEFQRDAIKPRIKLIKKLAAMKPHHAIREMRREFYDKFTATLSGEQATAHQEGAADTLEELESSAQRFDSIDAFIRHIDVLKERYLAMHPEHAAQRAFQSDKTAGQSSTGRRFADPQEDVITLMTIHRAKGLEFPAVFLIGTSDGILPHRTALRKETPPDRQASAHAAAISPDGVKEALLEEERRLAYVAVTRARNWLYISSPAVVHGQKAEVSRFVREAWGEAVALK